MLTDDPECPNASPHATSPSPYPYAVERWKANASASYLREGKIRNSKVKAIIWYKVKDGPEHEYIVAECHRPEERKVFYLRIERQPANHYESSVLDVHAAKTDPCKSTFWTFLQKLAHRFKPRVAAMDSISQVLDHMGSFGEEVRQIARYDFENQLFVRDLAFLSSIIHSYQPKYELFVYQCYWYCRTIINVLIEEYQPAVTHGKHFEDRGTFTLNRPFLRSRRLTVNRRCGHEVNRIGEAFTKALESHNEEVQRVVDTRYEKQRELARKLLEPKR